MRITILIGTMTGTAQLCAQEMELALGEGDTQIEALLMDGLDASVFERAGVFLICTSTYGQGDVPDNARGRRPERADRAPPPEGAGAAPRPAPAGVVFGGAGRGGGTCAETFHYGG